MADNIRRQQKTFGGGDTGVINNQPMDKNEYEDLIRRLKLLSKAQSTFLKFYLQGKLSSGASLVSKALVKIRHLKREDPSLVDIETALAALKLEELEVDYTSAEQCLREEFELLRNSVYGKSSTDSIGNPSVPLAPSTNNNAGNNSISLENSNLRSLLAEAKSEILAKERQIAELSSHPIAPPAPPSSNTNTSSLSSTEEKALKSEISSLKSQLAQKEDRIKVTESSLTSKENEIISLKDTIKEKEKLIANLNSGEASESNKLQTEISQLKQDIEKLKKESQQALKEQLQKQKEEYESKIKTIETKNEKEKEEMMETMAQEIEAVEKKHAEDGASSAKETKKLQKSVNKLTTTVGIVSNSLNKIKPKIATLAANHKALAIETKKQIADMKVALKEQMGLSVIGLLKDYDKKMEELRKKYRREMNERKKLHNMLQELKGNIRVYMRSRPPSEREIEQHGADSLCVQFLDDNEVKLTTEKGREKTFQFDEVFGLDATQEQIYAEVSPLVTSVLDGYSVCIFAYGQTGSGKTFTMNGPPDNRGVNTRALDELFVKSQARSDEWKDVITVSILEVYNEVIRDLLVANGGDEKLEVRQGEFGNHVPGLTMVPVSSLSDVEQLLSTADRNRSQASTDMNEHSSRSHMMLQVSLICEHSLSGQIFRGKLNLVDLAGSERINKSGATGQALKEAQNINKSLAALGNVIQARALKQGHIPFRDSTLTYLLQDCLSQDSKTLMFVCVSPVLYNADESSCSLTFAARVRTVELGKATKKTITAGSASAMAATASSSAASIKGGNSATGSGKNPRGK